MPDDSRSVPDACLADPSLVYLIGPYSSSTLARSPLPPKLRAIDLFLDDNSGPEIQDFTSKSQQITATATMITAEEDSANESMERAMKLLDARERILVGSGRQLISHAQTHAIFALVMGISEYNFSGSAIVIYFAGHGEVANKPDEWTDWETSDNTIEMLRRADMGLLDEDNNAVEGIPDRAISELLLQLSEAKGGNSARRGTHILYWRRAAVINLRERKMGKVFLLAHY
ncbi:hypothetical protein ARMSODRAFT_976766 [Armillaria solidipes]|uniref:Uncharacterized protein n=1 Tax=Armillaria solidipes TaxID=1076256 RepID=A0A2H3BCZ2_9AGAR|nr:hypothetical protein ARMSODRAFT_976766 [Armillaria solidipes]